MNWKAALKALGMAAVSGGAAAAMDGVADTPTNGKAIAMRAAIGAAVGAVMYLKQSPIPAPPEKGK